MGTWGPGIYQDDVTCDIKEDYLDRLRVGYSNEEATSELIERSQDFIDDEDDAPLFWFALADTQWKYGRLLPYVKEKAIEYINSGVDLERWEENKSLYNKRKKVLEELAEKLDSPQPAEKKVGKIKTSKAEWEAGDVLLYKIKDFNNCDTNFINKYILIKVISIGRWNIGSLPIDKYCNEINVVCIYNWIGDNEPDVSIIKNLKFLTEKTARGYIIDKTYIFIFNRKELKMLDFKVISKEKNYKYYDEKRIDGAGGIVCRSEYINDDLINDIKNSYNSNEIIDERKIKD